MYLGEELRFDDKVVIVTGAGNGLGKHYALAFARRGAKVVVNDLGCTNCQGTGKSCGPADAVVEQIRREGGTAIASYDSVEDGGAIARSALENFHRIDILINNAGIIRDSSFQNMSEENWFRENAQPLKDAVYRYNLRGVYACSKAVWPYMRKQRYGRIVNLTSASGLYGNFGQVNYSAAKLGIVGFSNSLSLEGERYGIRINCVAPTAASRMTAAILPDDVYIALKPEYVVPIVLFLAHAECTDNGGIFELGGGWIGKLRWERSRGAYFPLDKSYTPEEVLRKWNDISCWENSTHPQSTQEAFQPILRSIRERGTPAEKYSSQSSQVFHMLRKVVETQGAELVHKFKGVAQFHIDGSVWTVDLKDGAGSISEGTKSHPDVIVSISDNDFMRIVSGKTSVAKSFAEGKVKIQGDAMLAMKLEPLYRIASQRSKL